MARREVASPERESDRPGRPRIVCASLIVCSTTSPAGRISFTRPTPCPISHGISSQSASVCGAGRSALKLRSSIGRSLHGADVLAQQLWRREADADGADAAGLADGDGEVRRQGREGHAGAGERVGYAEPLGEPGRNRRDRRDRGLLRTGVAPGQLSAPGALAQASPAAVSSPSDNLKKLFEIPVLPARPSK